MADAFQIKVYWENRQESVRQCGARLATMLEGFAQTNAALARWNNQAMTPSKANTSFCTMPPRVDELATIFEEHRARKDFPPGEPWPEQGYFISAWNGHNDSHGLSFMIHAGGYASHLPCPNWVELHLPRLDGENADLINPVAVRAILKRLIVAWQPRWGGVISLTYRRLRMPPQPQMAREELMRRRPIQPPTLFRNPGWIVYLSSPYARLFTTPPSASIEDLPDGGILASTADQIFSSENQRDLVAADELGTALERLQADVRALQ